jgi:hypothetical protein
MVYLTEGDEMMPADVGTLVLMYYLSNIKTAQK